MIHVVTPENEHFYRDEMDQAYRLRHKVFVEEMGWKNMAKPDGREMDQFDTKHAVNMLYIEGGNVLGYQGISACYLQPALTCFPKSCLSFARLSAQ